MALSSVTPVRCLLGTGLRSVLLRPISVNQSGDALQKPLPGFHAAALFSMGATNCIGVFFDRDSRSLVATELKNSPFRLTGARRYHFSTTQHKQGCLHAPCPTVSPGRPSMWQGCTQKGDGDVIEIGRLRTSTLNSAWAWLIYDARL